MNIGNYSFTYDQNPFRLSVFQAESELLRIFAPSQTFLNLNTTDQRLSLEFANHCLTILVSEAGLELRVTPADAPFSLAFEMSGHWYGHGELINQLYPLNRLMLPESPFQTFDNGPAGQSCKLTPAWYSSKGLLILAHTPVSVGINQPPAGYPRYDWSLGVEKGPFSQRPFTDTQGEGDGLLTISGANLQLTIGFEANALSAYQRLVSLIGHPESSPPAELFIKPTWTTWARYKTNVSQELVLRFADEIIQNGYPYGVLEIDDRWQVHYGDISFDLARFPNPKAMIEQLHARGFKVTAWVIPFLDPQSQAFADGKTKGYLVRQRDGQPYLVTWWQGRGGLLDASNPSALEWFRLRLERLMEETGLDGFKFDAGEAAFYPADALSAESILPNEFTQRYIAFIAQNFSLTEVRSGWMNQRAPIFFRQWDKWSSWGLDNGLHSVLTGILALGLTGYPFILPDMVGGNEYDNDHADAELMIRWTQLNALLPALQFSLAPWERGQECGTLCRRYTELHIQYAPRILELADEAVKTGAPLIRPLWWLAPSDERALMCDDQFLLGNDILVAPVLKMGARTRDIYLPPGRWRDHWNGQVFEGERVLVDYPAALDLLPFFERE